MIDLWLSRFSKAHERLAVWSLCLNDDERAFAARVGDYHRASRFVGRRAMVRHILAHYVGDRPAALRFGFGPFGKPALLETGGSPSPHFNLSHTDDLAVLAVTWDGEIGIDVEHVKPIEENVAGLFSPEEQRQVAIRTGAAALHAFYRYWTCKEAVLKLVGTGLALPPDQVHISPPDAPAALLSMGGDRDEAERCIQLKTFMIPETYVGAVAARSDIATSSVQTWAG